MPTQSAAKRHAGMHVPGRNCHLGRPEPRGPGYLIALCVDCGDATVYRDAEGLARCSGAHLARREVTAR